MARVTHLRVSSTPQVSPHVGSDLHSVLPWPSPLQLQQLAESKAVSAGCVLLRLKRVGHWQAALPLQDATYASIRQFG